MEEEKENQVDSSSLALVTQRLESAEKSIAAAKRLLLKLKGGQVSTGDIDSRVEDLNISAGGKIVEGIFDGQNMIGPDKRQYPVPANYASKSKLVEGDILKLTIADDGSFIYKQIGPIQRRRVSGLLKVAEGGGYIVEVEGKEYKVLLASVTYYKAEEGDEVVVLLPEDEDSEWAAIDNVVKSKNDSGSNERAYKDALSAFESDVKDESFDKV